MENIYFRILKNKLFLLNWRQISEKYLFYIIYFSILKLNDFRNKNRK